MPDIRILFILAFIAFRIYRAGMANRRTQTDGMSDLSSGGRAQQKTSPPSPSGEPLAPRPRGTNQMNPMRQSGPTAPRVSRPKSKRRNKDDPFGGMGDPTGGSDLTIDDIIT